MDSNKREEAKKEICIMIVLVKVLMDIIIMHISSLLYAEDLLHYFQCL